MVQLSHPYMTTGKTIALTKVVSLLFNILSRLVIAFLTRSKHLLISRLQSQSAVILELKKIKSATVSTISPSICHEVMGLDVMILVFWMSLPPVQCYEPPSIVLQALCLSKVIDISSRNLDSSLWFIQSCISHDVICITLPTKVCLVKVMVFPIFMYGCESWIIKKVERWRIDAFELLCWRRLLSPLDCKEIQLVHPKGNQSWVFIGRNDAKAETPILQPPDTKSWLIWKDTDARKDWGQEDKGKTEDEMVGWHHRLNGHGFG